jgi:hypothetical protein
MVGDRAKQCGGIEVTKKGWLAVSATAVALVLAASTFDAAQAHRGGGYRGGGGHFAARSYSGRSFGGARFIARSNFVRAAPFRHRHVRRGFVGVPLAYGAYAYSYGGSCRWLRYRALETGSGYWWSRYYDCINGYY